MPIIDYVFQDYKKYPDRLALVNGLTGQSLTFAQARDAVWRVASGLARHGVRQDDVVMIISENTVEYVLAFHAVLSLGATLTMANPIYHPSDLVNQARDSKAKFVIGSHRCLSKTLEVAGAMPEQIKKVFLSGGNETGCVPFSSLLEDDGSMYPSEVKFDPRTQVALLPYSSGTTGMPKGVMLSHYNEVANSCQLDSPAFYDQREGVVQLGVLPFYHIYSVMATFMTSLAWGQTSIIVPGFDPRLFLEVVPKHKVNVIFIVPPMLMFLNKHPMAAKADLSSLNRLISGAAPLNEDACNEFHKKHPNCFVSQGWGMTEMSPVITGNLLKTCAAKPTSTGVPLPNTELKLLDPATGKECAFGDHGEICCRGPQVMLGYLNNEKATKEMIDEDGWLHTGDVGYIDEEHHLYISDRMKELIKYKGLQVPPAELESVLCSHPAVGDAGVIGIPDADGGEVPRAYVSLKPGGSVSSNELHKFVNDRVVAYKRLRGGIEIISEVPRSAAGKILRKQLKEIAKSPTVDTTKFSPLMME